MYPCTGNPGALGSMGRLQNPDHNVYLEASQRSFKTLQPIRSGTVPRGGHHVNWVYSRLTHRRKRKSQEFRVQGQIV